MGARARACACARVGLLIQYVTRKLHIVYVRSGSTFFEVISKTARFSGKVIEHKMWVLIFSSILFETFLILRRIQRDIVLNVKTSSCKVPLLLSDFNKT